MNRFEKYIENNNQEKTEEKPTENRFKKYIENNDNSKLDNKEEVHIGINLKQQKDTESLEKETEQFLNEKIEEDIESFKNPITPEEFRSWQQKIQEEFTNFPEEKQDFIMKFLGDRLGQDLSSQEKDAIRRRLQAYHLVYKKL